MPEALSWEPPKEKVKATSWWEGGSWRDQMSLTRGFAEQTNHRPYQYLKIDESDHLKSLYELCLPYYEKLYANRLPVNSESRLINIKKERKLTPLLYLAQQLSEHNSYLNTTVRYT